MPSPLESRARAEQIARVSYGRLVALVAARTRDIAAAEDALSEAFVAALSKWPEQGLPDNPEAWLLTVARNRLKDVDKSAARRTTAGSLDDETFAVGQVLRSAASSLEATREIPDERLGLLFACAHPAIDEKIHTPLMLQTVLGFEAKDIASGYLMPASALAQRLVRAKRKIKANRIPFEIPEEVARAERLDSVLEAIYGAYALSWSDPDHAEGRRTTADEAVLLAHYVAELLPEEPEAFGLAALLTFSAARAQAREATHFVPLHEQPAESWDKALLRRAVITLQYAAKRGRPGRFQIEAAIQSAHADRAHTGVVDWPSIVRLYEGLLRIAPTAGAAAARAAAVGFASGAPAGLRALEHDFPDETLEAVSRFQPYWAVKAHLLKELGDAQRAESAYARAISLCTDPRVRAWLELEASRTRRQ
ncbi:MAG: DUF6596 domain-containing protein [Myxococcota bacterium]